MQPIEARHSRSILLSSVLIVSFAVAVVAQSPRARPSVGVEYRFRFSAEAQAALRTLWQASAAGQQERVACLGARIEDITVFVYRVLPLDPFTADDSTTASATESIERCGPPEWQGTAHTHVALYDETKPYPNFSGLDREVMRTWRQRWNQDGVFCVLYTKTDAHCEAGPEREKSPH